MFAFSNCNKKTISASRTQSLRLGKGFLLFVKAWSQLQFQIQRKPLVTKHSLSAHFIPSKSPRQSSSSVEPISFLHIFEIDWHFREPDLCFYWWCAHGQRNDTVYLLHPLKVRWLIHSQHSNTHQPTCIYACERWLYHDP